MITAYAPNAAACANAFLSFSEFDSDTHPPIDQMKIQKLLFYAHAWCLALKEQPLFDEDIEAWPWGPVVREIYNQTREYGRKPITKRFTYLVKSGDGALDWEYKPASITDPETLKFLEEIWRVHKPFSGIQLSNSTHAQGEPWAIIRNKYKTLDGKPNIPNELIAEVFKKKAAGDGDQAAD
ncbi:MAG: type II toxin-antitoxin system antitoxin SocA domain-containing protein [Pseudomonadota bacterium]